MKKNIFLTLTALLLTLLCACSPAESAPQTDSAPAQETQPAKTDTVSMQAVPVKSGIQAENSSYFYYAKDGTRAEEVGLHELDGRLYYFNQDHSLHEFVPGLNDCEGVIYVHAGQDGFSFSPWEAGLWELDGALYDVTEDGSVLQDALDGYLYFGADGRYTSGNAALDGGVQALLDAACDAQATRDERLRQTYDYIRDNFSYLSMQHYDAGTTDWAESAALSFLENGKGNCYCFAGLFMYCARRLGYQAYVVAGWESKPTNDHAWTMIEQEGKTLLYDTQLEYAYLYMFGRDPVDMFAAEGEDGVYRGFRYYFP